MIARRPSHAKYRAFAHSIWPLICIGVLVTGLSDASFAQTVGLQHVEVTQGIQDLGQSVPLIAGKRTFVRAFFSYTGPKRANNVTGTIELRRRDGTTAIVPSLANVASALDPAWNDKLEAKRQSLEHGLIFEIPTQWAAAGDVTLRVTGIKAADGSNINCASCASALSIRFGAAAPVRVVMVGMRYTRNGQTRTPRAIDYQSIVSWLQRAYPAANFEFQTKVIDWDAPAVFDSGLIACTAANAVILALRKLDVGGHKNALFHYYGVVYDGGQDEGFMRGCADAPPTPDASAVGSGPAGTGGYDWDHSASYAGWYAGHELGHTFGRPHPGSGCGDLGQDPTWPKDIPTNQIGTAAHPYVGFDPGDVTVGASMQVLPWDPSSGGRGADMMTYCANVWPSAHTYIDICQRLAAENNVSCPTVAALVAAAGIGPPSRLITGPGGRKAVGQFLAAPLTQLAADQPAADNVPSKGDSAAPANNAGTAPLAPPSPLTGPVLSITGQINLDANTGTISAVHQLEQSIETNRPPVQADAPLIRTFNSAGTLLSENTATVLLSSDAPPDAPKTGLISGEVPYSKDIYSVELVRRGAVLARRIASSTAVTVSEPALDTLSLKSLLPLTESRAPRFNFQVGPDALPPRAEQTGPNGQLIYRWQGQGAGLTKYTVQISTDGGKTWSTVAVETSQNSITIDPSWIEGATELTVRVRASDGIHETVSTSAPLDFNKKIDVK
jgi:hypothetical protein